MNTQAFRHIAVTAIIEREKNGETEVLVQTRSKPGLHPEYVGVLEFPGGCTEDYENLFDTLKREVFEETGLMITNIYPDVRTQEFTPRNDAAYAFLPYICYQQLKGGNPWVGFAFVCNVKDEEPVAQEGEVSNVRWIKKVELREIFKKTPEQIFTLHLGIVDHYVHDNNRPKS